MYKALLTYDGTCYFGWQKTAMGPSIQEALSKAILQIAQEEVLPEAASRTDRGVHARGQVVQFQLQKPIQPQMLLKALNAVLPVDIRLKELVFEEFHPTLDSIGKEYLYQICLAPTQSPIKRLYSWHYYLPTDPIKIAAAAEQLIGTHDFTSFANEAEKNPICTIESILFDGGKFQIKGDRFLYKMVRNLVGTLIYAGSGKIDPNAIGKILASRDRKQAGITAPAHGLYLHQVFYPVR